MSGTDEQRPHVPIIVNDDKCIRCVICDFVCPGDIIYKDRGDSLPVIAYPDQCWYCGVCEQSCPTEAITIEFPQNMLDSKVTVRSLLGDTPEDSGMTP